MIHSILNNQLCCEEFNDDDVAEIFMDTLEKDIKEIYKKFKFPKKMIMTMHDKIVYDNSTLSHICNEELGEDRVCDLVVCLVSLEEVCNLKQGSNVFSSCISQFVWL